MNRTLLAAEAHALTRQILASLPFHLKLGRALPGLIRLAAEGDDVTLGLAVISVMVKRGTVGYISESRKLTIEDVNLRKPNAGLMTSAREVGGKILNIAKKKHQFGRYDPESQELAMSRILDKLFSGSYPPPSDNKDVGAVINYVAKGLAGLARDAYNSAEQKHRRNPSGLGAGIEFSVMSNPRTWAKIPRNVAMEIEKALQRDPIFLEKGEPRFADFVDGLLDGKTKAEIAREMGISLPPLLKWIQNPKRMEAFRKIVTPLLDHFAIV